MPSRTPIWIATAGNCVVAATTLALRGWSSAGVHAAARNTARFSMLWLMVGFAAPGLVRWLRGLPSEARLIQAFTAAHAVHFAVVALLLATFESAHIAKHPGQAALSVLGGFTIVMAAGFTAAPRVSRLYTVIHQIALYAVFLLFLAAFSFNAVKPLRVLAVFLGLALLLRLTSRLTGWSERVRTAE
jgi:hypothetical protein